nr:MAG TPA: hypothetical protein [Caudoviricetes sp.]
MIFNPLLATTSGSTVALNRFRLPFFMKSFHVLFFSNRIFFASC